MSVTLSVKVFEDSDALARAAAEFVAQTAMEAIDRRGTFSLALSGGGTPEPVYGLLAGQSYRERIDWKSARILWGDERCVPPDDPGSNYGQAKRLLLDHVGIPAGQIRRIKGELAPEAAAADYREQLAELAPGGREWPILDLALMGLGADGHTASLFPGLRTPEEDRLTAVAVTAEYDGRPAHRVSLTPLVFNSARNVLFLATGANKAQAVGAVVDPNADPDKWPAARIVPANGLLYYYLDEPAASGIARNDLLGRP